MPLSSEEVAKHMVMGVSPGVIPSSVLGAKCGVPPAPRGDGGAPDVRFKSASVESVGVPGVGSLYFPPDMVFSVVEPYIPMRLVSLHTDSPGGKKREAMVTLCGDWGYSFGVVVPDFLEIEHATVAAIAAAGPRSGRFAGLRLGGFVSLVWMIGMVSRAGTGNRGCHQWVGGFLGPVAVGVRGGKGRCLAESLKEVVGHCSKKQRVK